MVDTHPKICNICGGKVITLQKQRSQDREGEDNDEL